MVIKHLQQSLNVVRDISRNNITRPDYNLFFNGTYGTLISTVNREVT